MRKKSGTSVICSLLPPALSSVFPPQAAHKADPPCPRERAGHPSARAAPGRGLRTRALLGRARPGPSNLLPPRLLSWRGDWPGDPALRARAWRAPPCRLQRSAVAWGAASGRGSVTALRRALGGIVAVSGAKSSLERGPALRVPQSKRSLRLSSGGAGGERERSVPVSTAYAPLPQVTRCKEQRCTSCGFCSAKGPGAAPVLACRLHLDPGRLGVVGAEVPGNRKLGDAVPSGPSFPAEGSPFGSSCISSLKRHFLGLLPLWGAAHASRIRPAARESPVLSDHSVLSCSCFILSSPRLPGERRAGNEEPLAASAGGWGEAGPMLQARGPWPSPPHSVLRGAAEGFLGSRREARECAANPVVQKQDASRFCSRPSGLLSFA